jgi:hypothetical protein
MCLIFGVAIFALALMGSDPVKEGLQITNKLDGRTSVTDVFRNDDGIRMYVELRELSEIPERVVFQLIHKDTVVDKRTIQISSGVREYLKDKSRIQLHVEFKYTGPVDELVITQ